MRNAFSQAVAALALLLAGTGGAHAVAYATYTTQSGCTVPTVCGSFTNVNIDPTAFGGFETTGELPGNWGVPTGSAANSFKLNGILPNAGFSIVADGQGYTTSPLTEGKITSDAVRWRYISLQNITVPVGATVTVSVEIKVNSTSDWYGFTPLAHGATASSTIPTYSWGFYANQVNTWVAETASFVATSSNLDIDFGFINAELTTPLLIDAVSITYATSGVPEPASLALLGAGLLGLGLVRRRRRA